MLTAIVNQFQAVGCQQSCNGYCIPRQTLTCQADATSGTGGRCLVPALLSLTAANDGGSFNVPVGSEIDVLLENASSNGYTNDVLLSSGAATVLEVTIPAGPMPSGGSTHLYRLRAASAGRVTVQIPYVAAASEAAHPAYTVTLDVESAAADASAAP